MYNKKMNEKHKNILKKSTVLIVDDDKNLRNIFKKTINPYVYDVLEASNGNEALDIFNKERPNIIFTDIKMPIMDGLFLVTVIRQIDKKVPIVAISGYSESDTLIKLIPLELTDYLVKPVNFEQLISTFTKCAEAIESKGIFEFKLTKNSKYSYTKKCLVIDDENISLTPNEITLIELLIENTNKLVTLSQIEYIIYNNENVTNTAINTLVSKLRKKIGTNIINSIHSQGYIMYTDQ